jgi:O-antigen/teichoic acid export membrane protein
VTTGDGRIRTVNSPLEASLRLNECVRIRSTLGVATPLFMRVGRVGGSTLAASVSSVLVVVVLARVTTLVQWSSIAVGQSVGALGAIAVSLGWTVSGPSLIAVMDPEDRAPAYLVSLVTRAVALLAVAPLAAAAAWLLDSGGGPLAPATAVATCFVGMSPRWFTIGLGASGDLLRFDVLPAVLANVASAGAVAGGMSPMAYPALVALAYGWGCAAFSLRIARGLPPPTSRVVSTAWRRQRVVTLSELLLSGFSVSGIAIASTRLSVADTAQFAADFRLLQWFLLAVYILTQGTQGWAVELGGRRPVRLRIVLSAHAALGVTGGLLLALLGPGLSTLLLGDGLTMSGTVSSVLGIAFLAVAIATGVGTHVLVVFDLARLRLMGAWVTVVVGVAGILILASYDGVEGAATALALATGLGCLVQVAAALRYMPSLESSTVR